MNYPRLKHRMKAYAVDHHLEIPPGFDPDTDVFGDGAKKLAWRVSGDLVAHKRMKSQTDRPQPLWDFFFPQATPSAFRSRLVHAYDHLNGVTYGSTRQREIAAFCGIPWTLPWCAATFWFAAKHEAGYNGPHAENVAFVPSWETFAQAHGLIVPFRAALPGMAVTFCWDGRRYVGSGDHIGIIDEPSTYGSKLTVATDEGNASGAVRQETRYWSNINLVFDIAKLQK